MRFLSHFSMAVALATAGSLAATAMPQEAQAQEAKPRKVKLSKEFRKAAGPVQKLVEAGDPAGKPLVEQLLAQPWTGDDADVAGQFAINLGARIKDTALQEKGIDKRLGSGMLAGADKAKMLFYSGSFARQRGDNARAETQLKAAIAAGYPGPGAHLELANGYSAQKQHSQSLEYLSQAIEIQNKTANRAPEDWYRASRDRALATNDKELYSKWATKWAAAYPSPDSWNDAITAYRFKSQTDGIQNLEVLRFMKASGALTKYRDYKEFAEEAQKKNLFGEVVDVLEEGRSKGVVSANDSVVGEILSPTKRRLASDRSSLPAAPSAVRGSGSASVMMNFADTWLGYKDYAKAVTFYQAGLGKAGADANRGNIGIGTAQAYAGDLAAAKSAFEKVNGTRAPLADMWKMWIDQQAKPAAAVASTGS